MKGDLLQDSCYAQEDRLKVLVEHTIRFYYILFTSIHLIKYEG